MARTTPDDHETDAKPDPKRTDASHDGPVLVLVKRSGPYRACYTRPADPRSVVAEKTGPGAVEPVTIQLPPGLGLVPARHWPSIKAQSRFQARLKAGQIVVVAGDEQPLAQGWGRLPQVDALAYLEKTGDVATLEMLREVEAKATRPRHEVADAIDDALRRVERQRERLRAARQTQRQQHRRAAW
jgi:hypothetical protein